MTERANAFTDLDDFAPKPRATKSVATSAIERVAAENNFPSRRPAATPAPPVVPSATQQESAEPVARRAVRRHVTGRNQQINVKATGATIDRFYRLADERGLVLGELLEQALDALERAGREKQ
jgi:hypothetical protein